MVAPVHYFGVRHHGPGSARQLEAALSALAPAAVLVEGPSDATELLPMLAHRDMRPPVALLTYPADQPEQARFFPFASWSPEYRAVRWALEARVALRFIDLPAGWQPPEAAKSEAAKSEAAESEVAESEAAAAESEAAESETVGLGPADPPRARDPIGRLAAAAGFEDGESWWRELVEENPAPGPVFEAIEEAMAALREDEGEIEPREAAREAHMRLEIAKVAKEAAGPVAVVCGAWHVPALRSRATQKADRALARGGRKLKVKLTWAPWTSPRLAFGSGYGAGVEAPEWCRHLWETPAERMTASWLAKVAAALRASGRIVSVASIIEAERLARTLTAMRGRSAPGFEELRDAAVACLCFGEPLVWASVAPALLVGSAVGEVPDDVPLSPLLEDLKRQQKATRLKPEALERELALDLRTDSGLGRSTLLHRLSALGVPWGRLTDAGGSRGTFRERWILEWTPELAVDLVEHVVYGPTIEQAASGRLEARLQAASTLAELAELVQDGLRAQLPAAARAGVALLSERAAGTSDTLDLLRALPPLGSTIRYGEARTQEAEPLQGLFRQLATQAALSLEHAARELDADAARDTQAAIRGADQMLRLVEGEGEVLDLWTERLHGVVEAEKAAKLVLGGAARLLYEAGALELDAAARLLERQLSPGTPAPDAAAFFEGFFEGAGARLIHDRPLRAAVDAWLQSLDAEMFQESLPLMRRVFQSLDPSERSRLLDALFGRKTAALPGLRLAPEADRVWAAQLERVLQIWGAAP